MAASRALDRVARSRLRSKILRFSVGERLSIKARAIRSTAFVMAAVVGAPLLISSPAAASCVRHFKNLSDVSWEIAIYKDNMKLDEVVNIAPNSTQRWTWTHSLWHLKDPFYSHITMSRDGQVQCDGSSPVTDRGTGFVVAQCAYKISGQPDGDCVYIEHDGNTGPGSVNEPANGDLWLE